jgi:hypothetical protein
MPIGRPIRGTFALWKDADPDPDIPILKEAKAVREAEVAWPELLGL